MDRQKIIFLMIGVLFILLIIVQLVAYFILRKKDVGLLPDHQSAQRIQTINQLLIAYFGNNWPTVLTGILVLILIVLALLLVVVKKPIEINATEKTFKWLNIAGVTFLVLLSIGVVFSIYRIYTEAQKNQAQTQDQNIELINNQKKQLIQLFAIITGLIFLILIILGGGLWGYKKLKEKMFNKAS